MKFPSLQTLTKAAAEVLVRFPLEIFCALIGTSLMLWQIGQNEPVDGIVRTILCSILGLALFLSVSVFSESHRHSKRQRSLLQGAGVVLLVLCWFSLAPIEHETSVLRYALLFAAVHLLVSFAPKTTLDGFWEYNKQLFLRILVSGLYSGVLFVGLCIAVAATDFLFNLNLDNRIYPRLFVAIAGVFNTVFFLAGVPRDFSATQPYPKGLKIFTQYVLIPLATIYLTIILVYEGKVLVEWTLPTGVISWLILGYAVYGILSILLVYPVRKQEENKWIATYSKLFYVLLLPLLPLLAVAIGVRVLDYGITEPRYIVLILAAWLTGITVYFLVSKKQNIKLIPISLAVVALLSAWGPQSASAVSERSQVERLVNLFKAQSSFAEGKLQPMPSTLADSVGTETIDQLRYLTDTYGSGSLANVLPTALADSLLRSDTIKNMYTRRYQAYETLRKGLALKSYYQKPPTENNYYEATAQADSIAIEDYAFVKQFGVYSNGRDNKAYPKLNNESLEVTATKTFSLTVVLSAMEERAKTAGQNYLQNVPRPELMVTTASGKLVIQRITFTRDSLTRSINQVEGFVLFD